MLQWIKTTKLYLFLFAAVVGLVALWGEWRKSEGKAQAEAENEAAHRERENYTRERGRRANEDIRSGGDSFIPDWLRKNNRSRFLLTAPPLNLPGAVGSPANAIATV